MQKIPKFLVRTKNILVHILHDTSQVSAIIVARCRLRSGELPALPSLCLIDWLLLSNRFACTSNTLHNNYVFQQVWHVEWSTIYGRALYIIPSVSLLYLPHGPHLVLVSGPPTHCADMSINLVYTKKAWISILNVKNRGGSVFWWTSYIFASFSSISVCQQKFLLDWGR